MKNFIHFCVASLVIFGSQASSAAILNFDDVPGGSIKGSYGDMPTYQGFNFSSTLDWIDVEGSSWNYGAHSGDFVLTNNESGIGTIIEAGTIDFFFDGLWAKHKSTKAIPVLSGSLSGYNDGTLVWEVNTDLDLSYQYFGPQAGLIDELRLGFGNLFLVDDIELTAVPVPAAAWLFSSGLIALLGVVRRRSKI